MAKEKVNYQEVYDLYQLCSETKDLREFCADYGVNYDKFMNWQRHQLWSEKLGKTESLIFIGALIFSTISCLFSIKFRTFAIGLYSQIAVVTVRAALLAVAVLWLLA